jgi:hypothetical protein
MRTARSSSLAVIAAVVLVACAGGYSSGDQLQRQVDTYNDQVRWGRVYSAAELVREDTRGEWLRAHRAWGPDLQIADYEVVDSTMQGDGVAMVRVTISWYRPSQSELQTTLLAQRWRREARVWQLESEEVEEGAPL